MCAGTDPEAHTASLRMEMGRTELLSPCRERGEDGVALVFLGG